MASTGSDAMVVNRQALKRAKGRLTADLCDFLTFPADGDGISDGIEGPFRVSVREFLVRHARLPPPSSILLPSAVASPHLIPWRITFRVGDLEDAVVQLNVVEEDVLRSKSIYCDHCRIVGENREIILSFFYSQFYTFTHRLFFYRCIFFSNNRSTIPYKII